jgi:hypothetical protein
MKNKHCKTRSINVCIGIGMSSFGKLYPTKLLPIAILTMKAASTINRSNNNTPHRGKYEIFIQREKISDFFISLAFFFIAFIFV